MKIIILTYAKDNFEVTSMDRLIEEAKKRGHNIRRLRYSDCSMTIEDGEAKVYYKGNELLVSDAVIPWIIQGDFKYGVDVVRQFESMQDVFVLNGSVAIADACDKWRTAQILAREGIPIPDTYRALAYDAMYNHIDTLPGQRQIVKILTGTRGNGVILSPDKETTKSIAGTFGILRDDYVVQEFIEESSGVDIRAYVVGGAVVASMERRASNGFRSNLKLGGKGSTIILTDEERALAVKTATVLGLGSAGVDIMRTNRGPVVIEANASGEFGIEQVTGRNVAEKIIEYIEQNAKRRPRKDKIGA